MRPESDQYEVEALPGTAKDLAERRVPPAAHGVVRCNPAGMCRMTHHGCAVGHGLVAAHRGVLHNGAD
jgi:hypothetical protein